ncbi:uracil-DNA glycosylase [Pelagibacteraceae bacterium]|nr:uracil-DNA glycosylase [Pelagibacteraceae bacterium]
MTKKINTKLTKLIKYYNLINYNLVYDNLSINRYKKNKSNISGNKEDLLKNLESSIKNIKNCELKKNAIDIVFADGHPDSKIMIVAEGPGANEDEEGLPFLGRAGQLLDKMLSSIKLSRDNVYITNVVNFRPPENRGPTDLEIKRYLPYLIKHIEIINPKILILLGGTALKAIIGNDKVISNFRGKWLSKKIGECTTLVIASFHPAFLMRQPTQKKLAWEDLKLIRKKIFELKIKIEN